ncbi:MAG: hypothetical protein II305_02135 [Clostridia bacterium]|nr:hypothetical protein [Clostridia bacterium]
MPFSTRKRVNRADFIYEQWLKRFIGNGWVRNAPDSTRDEQGDRVKKALCFAF